MVVGGKEVGGKEVGGGGGGGEKNGLEYRLVFVTMVDYVNCTLYSIFYLQRN